MIKKEKFVYDRSLRELFGEIPKTLIKLLVNQDIKEGKPQINHNTKSIKKS